jgi:hypothetical protein
MCVMARVSSGTIYRPDNLVTGTALTICPSYPRELPVCDFESLTELLLLPFSTLMCRIRSGSTVHACERGVGANGEAGGGEMG